MKTYSCVEYKEKFNRIPTTSTSNHHAQRISSMSVSLLNLHTTKQLSPVGK